MSTDITLMQTPEEAELKHKLAELAALETELAQRELDLATLQAELHFFETRYLHIVGVRYAELDEIKAQIAEAQASLNPTDETIRKRAERARAQAQESAQTTAAAQQPSLPGDFKPSENLKKLYREVAKRIHPDLATHEKERARRQELMAEANRAYEAGDEARLQAILREWESSAESIKGEGIGAELVRVIRKIAQVKERLRAIDSEIEALKNSDLYRLREKVEKAAQEGRDLLADMATRLDVEIADARQRLDELASEGRSK